MTLLEHIQTDMITAMRAKDELTLNTLRAIKTALDRYRTDQRKPIDGNVEQSVLKTQSKQRQEAAEAFRAGGREASALKEEAELRIIEAYMPKQATDEEIDEAIRLSVSELLATKQVERLSDKDMGTLMKMVPLKLVGKRADGKVLSAKVKTVLS